ncbi:MAG: NAD(P)-binding domain-containing protein, partial [Gemmatimonadales bacterium]
MGAEELLLQKAEDKSAVFGVMGFGYVGLPLAVELADAGYSVVGFDVSQEVVELVNSGESHVQDVPTKRLKPFVESGRISATTDMGRLGEVDAISICVPTPLSKTKDPDVSYILAAADAVTKAVRKGQAVILESTTYPGTTRELLLPRIQVKNLEVGRDVFLAFSPERVDPGNATWKTRNTPKVVGGVTPACLRVVQTLYEP